MEGQQARHAAAGVVLRRLSGAHAAHGLSARQPVREPSNAGIVDRFCAARLHRWQLLIRESREQEKIELTRQGHPLSRALPLAIKPRASTRWPSASRSPSSACIAPPSRSSAARPLCSRSWAFGSLISSARYKAAQVTGGIILILIGVKILLEHLGVLG